VEFYQLDSSLLVWLTVPSGSVWMVERPLGRETVEGMVKRLRRSLGVPAVEIRAGSPAARGLELAAEPRPDRPFAAVSRRAWRAWIGGVEKHLPSRDVPLVIVPHGALWHVPFAALQSPSGDWLGQWPLVEATSAEAVAAQQARPSRPPQRALVVGNPGTERITACGQDLRWRPLGGAEAEAKAIAARSWTEVDLLLGAQADPLRVGAWHGAYDVLHFATHGMVCPGAPLESFVLMAAPPSGRWSLGRNGSLWRTDDPRLPITVRDAPEALDGGFAVSAVTTAREVIDDWRLDADLVALSACETGLGPISSEGTIGLTRAFLAAGARSLLVSLWEVDDAATRDLMVAFYDGYLAHGDKARALRDAAAAVRRDHPDPRLWAAFILVGEP
jgi:CHAT domain-containing protein